MPCGSGSFQTWLDNFKTEAASKGISQATITSSLNGVTPDQSVLSRDHSQKVFDQSFEQFSGRMVPPRLARGANMMKQYGSVLSRIEETYGVPGEVLVAIWGLETDFGVNIGKFPTLRSLATLAYDCRRAEMFRGELLDALRIIDRGDLTPAEMRGAWAGEIGQTQFMPSNYIKYAVDFDANGRRDLLRSPPDVLASTANFLQSSGWQKGKDWQPGKSQLPCAPTVEQERRLCPNRGVLRHAAGPRAIGVIRRHEHKFISWFGRETCLNALYIEAEKPDHLEK